MTVNTQKFYNLFLEEIKKSGIESIPWNDSKEWTDRMLKDKNCVMEKMAKSLGLLYCHDYFYLDGIFYRKKLGYKNLDTEFHFYAQNIEVIIEHENDYRGIETEIYKLIPLFLAPLKVIITYFDGSIDENKNKIERIRAIIKNRIRNDNPFRLHKNKIKILLIIGFYKNRKIDWQGFIYGDKKFKGI